MSAIIVGPFWSSNTTNRPLTPTGGSQLAGFTLQTSFSAGAALDELAAQPADAILVDFRMPVMDGLQFLRELRARPSHRTIPVAVVTGDYQLEERVVAELQTLGAVLRFKPLWIDDLTTLVDDAEPNLAGGQARHDHEPESMRFANTIITVTAYELLTGRTRRTTAGAVGS